MGFFDQFLSVIRGEPVKKACTPSHLPTSTEARAWFRDNMNPYPFATNRFGRAEALDMVEAVYRAGASRVTVSGIYDEPKRIAEWCGPYADILFVTPKKGKKTALMKKLAEYEPDELDFRSGKIRVWWD